MIAIVTNFVPQRDPQSDPNCILRGQKTDPRRSRRGNGGQDGLMTPKWKPRDPPRNPKSSKMHAPRDANHTENQFKNIVRETEEI